MGSRYLTDLASVLRGAGLLVQEEPGWQSRSRSSGGYDSGKPNHVMVHHTASGPSSDGQPDVSYMCYSSDARPVANIYLSRSGKVWTMAAGATNTNGTGTCPHCGTTDNMNTRAIGIEAGNNGTGEAWPTAQQNAYITLCRVLCNHYGIANAAIISHAEYAPSRKVDPAGPSRWASQGTWPMAPFRAEVASGGSIPTTRGRSMFFMFRVIEHADSRPTFLTDGATYWQISGSNVVPTVNAMQEAMGYPDTAKPVHLLTLAALNEWKMQAREGTKPISDWPRR